MEKVRFSCTALAGTNKVGKLTPDADGYYTVVLGAFDFPNSAGAVYPWQSAKKLFTDSGALMRRIKTGQQRGECGHPKLQPGMTKAQYVQRILTIEETLVSHHISEVWIDDSGAVKDTSGRKVVAVMGKVKPCGPMGPSLKEQLENPKENVAFSVRSLTKDTRMAGVTYKHMTTCVTWDYVNEPGISVATKYDNPALESLEDDVVLSEADFTVAAEHEKAHPEVSNESGLDVLTVIDQQGFERKVARVNGLTDW